MAGLPHDDLLVGDVVLHEDVHTAHVTLLLGRSDGSFKNAFAAVMTSHRPGFIPFIVCAQPRLPILPRTVFVNKNPYESEEHGEFFWGAAHLGIASGMQDGIERGVLQKSEASELLCIAAAWVWGTATDRVRVCEQNRTATLMALEQAVARTPGPDSIASAIAESGYVTLFHTVPPDPA